MSAYLFQVLGAAALFGAIEGFESLLRHLRPGLHNRIYSALKAAFGLPLVLVCGPALIGAGGLGDWAAVGLGVGLGAAVALGFFGEPTGA